MKRIFYLLRTYRDFKSRVIITREYFFNPGTIGIRWNLERTANDRIARENPNRA